MAKDVWSATNEQQPSFTRLSSVAEREPGDSSFRYARALLDEPLKEMLVFHGFDLHEMSHELPAKRDHTRPRRHQPWELQAVQEEKHCNSQAYTERKKFRLPTRTCP